MLDAGCDDFVRKPFREEELFDKMAHHLGLSFVYEEEGVDDATPVELTRADLGRLARDLATRRLRGSADRQRRADGGTAGAVGDLGAVNAHQAGGGGHVAVHLLGGALDEVLQLADISRIAVGGQHLGGGRTEQRRLYAHLGGNFYQKEPKWLKHMIEMRSCHNMAILPYYNLWKMQRQNPSYGWDRHITI